MPTLTKTRAMSHADSLAVLNATAKKAVTNEAEKKKSDKKKKEEDQAKIQQASEEKKRDAARLKTGKAARTTQDATNKVNVNQMDLSNFR